ncbi:conserved protein, unknown function [Hepatocystis sp. ex Piliocolobus tephrosceles]|nr:conserved protein, unknown function [Hepatocystis sp. ex Piliocolobus tephrosceles]
MQNVLSSTTLDSDKYRSKDSIQTNRNDKSDNENSCDCDKFYNNAFENEYKETFDRQVYNNINDKLKIYDSIITELKELYSGNIVMNNTGLDKLNLKTIAKSLFLNINKTLSKKVRILIIGNPSSGKSTFINWFLQENIQKTGYEFETSNFTLITSGNYISEFNGEVTVKTFDFLKQISKKNKNFKYNLNTKMYISKNYETKHIDFIDTPGLKDIMDDYPFDINSIIYDLADYVDIILIFFDSSGKTLSNRLLLIIKEIYNKHMEKIFFIFSKIDEIKHEQDRIKLLCQTTQCLASKIHIRNNIDLLPIYIVGAKNGKYLFHSTQDDYNDICIINRINELIYEIKKLFFKKLERDLYCFIDDCDCITNKILEVLKSDGEKRLQKLNLKRERIKHTAIQIFLFCFFLFFLITKLSVHTYYKHVLMRYMNILNYKFYKYYIINTGTVLNNWDNSYLIINILLGILFLLSSIMKKKFKKHIKTLHMSSKEILREQLTFIKYAKDRGKYLTSTFFEIKDN